MDSTNTQGDDGLLPTSPTSPIAAYPPLPPLTTGGGRPQEFYGFVAWLTTYLAFILYLLWAFVPDEWILATGLQWYPSREWAALLPAYSIIIILLTYWTYWGLAIVNTPAFSDLRTITDSYAHIPKRKEGHHNPYVVGLAPNAIPEVHDMPIGLVNRLTFGKRKRPRGPFRTSSIET